MNATNITAPIFISIPQENTWGGFEGRCQVQLNRIPLDGDGLVTPAEIAAALIRRDGRLPEGWIIHNSEKEMQEACFIGKPEVTTC